MEETIENLDKLLIAYNECPEPKKKRILHIHIVQEALFLVKKIANSIAFQSGVSHEDLLQVGSVGLIKAISSYNPYHNTKFRTYATYFIKGEIKHYLRDKVSIVKTPRELQELLFKVTSIIEKLRVEGIDNPSPQDISIILGVDSEKIEEVMNIDKCKNALSLDQCFGGDDEDISLLDKIPSGDYQEFISSYEDKIMLAEVIQKLPNQLKEIIKLNYYDDLNQREIAEKLNISQMQVSRRLKKALNKMYEIIGNRGNL